MKTVRYEPQERVDLPDITAMSFLPIGEFRRTLRDVIGGGLTDGVVAKRIIKGFQVEVNAVDEIIVRLDINEDGTDLSSALGAHNHEASVGGTYNEFGVLIGGHDFNNDFEGTSSNKVNYSAALDDTYEIRMRWLLDVSDSDNRAFWDPASNTEFINNIETRFAPVWELTSTPVGSPPADVEQYFLLATVDVASGLISNIQDKRNFALEGNADGLAFQSLTQRNVLAVEDFNRNIGRETAPIGINALWPFVRALARQVMDIKGQDPIGNWNWFGRPALRAPLAAGGSQEGFDDFTNDIGQKETKSLRSVDTVTFMVGDGAFDFGDFNGPQGLLNCLRFIRDNDAEMPNNIVIMLKSRGGTSATQWSTGPWDIDDQVLLSGGRHIKIIGATHSVEGSDKQLIELTNAGPSFAIFMQEHATRGVGSLSLENLLFRSTAAQGVVTMDPAIVSGLPGRFGAKNCDFDGGPNTATAMIQVPSAGLQIDNCTLDCKTEFGGGGQPDTANQKSIGAKGGSVRRSVFGGALNLLIGQTAVGLSEADLDARVLGNGMQFDGCKFFFDDPTLITSTQLGFITGFGARGVRFKDCELVYDGDEDCIRTGAATIGGTNLYPAHDWSFENCRWLQINGGAEAPASGNGRAVKVLNINAATLPSISQVNTGFTWDNCTHGVGDGAAQAGPGGFGIYMQDCSDSLVFNTKFDYVIPSGSSFNAIGVNLVGSPGAGSEHSNIRIGVEKCSFDTNRRDATHNFRGVVAVLGSELSIHNNDFNGFVRDGAQLPANDTSEAINFVSIGTSQITLNRFRGFHFISGGVGQDDTKVCLRLQGVFNSIIADNTFNFCFGNVIFGEFAIVANRFSNNVFRMNIAAPVSGGMTGLMSELIPQSDQTANAMINLRQATFNVVGNGLDDDGLSTAKNQFLGNSWDLRETNVATPEDFRCIDSGGDRYASFINNHFYDGSIIIADYAAAVLPDGGRSHGFLDSNVNTVSFWREDLL